MPSIYPLFFNEQTFGHVFSDDTIALVRLRISSKTKLPYSSLLLYYYTTCNSYTTCDSRERDATQKKYILDENMDTENSTLISSLMPVPERFICELKTNAPKTTSVGGGGYNKNVYFDEALDVLKEQIRDTFQNKKFEFHQIISIPSVIFRVKPDKPTPAAAGMRKPSSKQSKVVRGSRDPPELSVRDPSVQESTPHVSAGTPESTVLNFYKISENVPCIIEWGTKLDPPKIYLYRDIISLEPNGNVIVNWWRKRMKQSKQWKYVIQLRSDSGVYGNNRYSTMLINRNMEIFYEWSYSTPLDMKDVIAGIGTKIQCSACETYGSNDLADLEMRECTIRYEIFLSVGDLYDLFECCATTLDAFFETPNEEKPFNLRYRPKYCNTSPQRCNITVRFQKMSLNNSIVIMIQTAMATWTALQDCLEVLYFLFDHERLKNLRPSEASYKDLDPYLFKTNVKKGGYTRQCLNYNDPKLSTKDIPVKRYKVPRILFTKDDHEMYDKLPDEHKRYILYYRGNYYAAIDDYRHNKDTIDNYNETTDKHETYLNTVVLFEIKEKYRDGTQEQLYYPGCVRAKSGMPPLKHRYILNKLLRNGEIDLVGKDGNDMKKRLETNEDLKRGDVIHYISKYSGRLTSDSYAYLPTLAKKMLIPFFENLSTHELIRKGAIDGQFVHALAEACLPNYRTEWPNKKIEIVKECMVQAQKIVSQQIYRWIHFGCICRQMSYETYCSQFKNFQDREHTYLYDIMSLLFNVNIFVLHLNAEGKLEKISRTTDFKASRKSVILLKYENSYEIILKMQRTKRKSTTEDCFLWEWKNMEPNAETTESLGMIRSLNKIFMCTNKIAQTQGEVIKHYRIWGNHVVAQVVDIFNKAMGIIDKWGFFLPFQKGCTPIPGLPMYSDIPKKSVKKIIERIQRVERTERHSGDSVHSGKGPYNGAFKFVVDPDRNMIIGIQCMGGEIIPSKDTSVSEISRTSEISRMSGTQLAQLCVSQHSIPYMEGVTHYRLKIDTPNDDRIQMISDDVFVKKVTGGILEELQRLLTEEKVVSPDAWNKMSAIRNVRDRQKRVFPVFMSLLSTRVFVSDENGTAFNRKPNVIIPDCILERSIFQSFHYISRNPTFGCVWKNRSSNKNKKKRKLVEIAETNECVVFQSIEDAEEFIRMIHITDYDLLDATEKSRTQLKLTPLCTYSYPLHHVDLDLKTIEMIDSQLSSLLSAEYVKHEFKKVQDRLKHLEIPKQCLHLLVWSYVLQRCVVIVGADDKTKDYYNPFAGGDKIIKLRN